MPDLIARLNAALEGRYSIERQIGEGGMATVYLAEDLRHARKVAVKVLKPELAAVVGADRFLAEIRTTANLQHPHILPLHDSGEADGHVYYVMPYIEGESLADRLEREKQLPVDEAVRIATDVAEALHAAHEQGVIHRDIKPANILLSRGRPLVADFGIALAVSTAGGGRLTETGLSMGTPYYMSPEQATADRDPSPGSDVYSLGCVLYEMLVGEPPFTGATAQAVLSKILTGTAPDATEARPAIPSHVAAAVRVSLEKIPADRFPTALAFAQALGDPAFGHALGGAVQAASVASRRAVWPMAVAMAVGAAATAAVFWLLPHPTPPTSPIRFSVPVPAGYDMSSGGIRMALSPSGDVLVFSEEGGLVRRGLADEASSPLEGTQGAASPFFSPNGETIGFYQNGLFRMIPSRGGVITPISASPIDGFLGVDWGEDGNIVFGRRAQGIWRVSVEGGEPEAITIIEGAGGESLHVWPQSLEGGSTVLFSAVGTSGKWHDSKILIQDLQTGERVTVVEGAAFGHYVPSGHLIYINEDGAMMAQKFDLGARTTRGQAVAVEAGIMLASWGGGASFAVSDGGVLAFSRGDAWGRNLLHWYDRTGTRGAQIGTAMSFGWGVELEPNGNRIATSIQTNRNDDIFLLEEGAVSPTRLSFGTGSEGWPVWSPDGARVAWQSDPGEGFGPRIYVRSVDGGGEPEILYEAQGEVWPRSWSPDGKWLAFTEASSATGDDVWVLNVDDPNERVSIHVTGSEEWGPRFSPDGGLLAFGSSDGGTPQIYVVTFPEVGDPLRVSVSNGREPMWASSKGTLFYWEDDTLIEAAIRTEPRLAVESTQSLFSLPDIPFGSGYYTVAPDGERLLISTDNPAGRAYEIHVVVNWFDELERLSAGN